MNRKLAISMFLIVTMLLLNIIGINLFSKSSLINNNILKANPYDRGWAPGTQNGEICMYCWSQGIEGCYKDLLPDGWEVCIHF